VDVHEKGLYLVEVGFTNDLRAYTLIMVTDLGLGFKNRFPARCCSLWRGANSGTPVEGAPAVVFNNHRVLAQGTTDAFRSVSIHFQRDQG